MHRAQTLIMTLYIAEEEVLRVSANYSKLRDSVVQCELLLLRVVRIRLHEPLV